MRTVIYFVVAGLGLGVPGLAQAQSFSGAEQLIRGDLPAAEREIAHQRRMFPNDPDLLVNLASIYGRTNRTADARRLYRDVLARADEPLTLADGSTVSSHQIALTGLRSLPAEMLAAR